MFLRIFQVGVNLKKELGLQFVRATVFQNAKYIKVSKLVDNSKDNFVKTVWKCEIFDDSFHSFQKNSLIRFLLNNSYHSGVPAYEEKVRLRHTLILFNFNLPGETSPYAKWIPDLWRATSCPGLYWKSQPKLTILLISNFEEPIAWSPELGTMTT